MKISSSLQDFVREAIQVAQHAGIQVKVITGDYRLTAERIASSIGLFQEGDQTLEGAQINALTDGQLQSQVKQRCTRIAPAFLQLRAALLVLITFSSLCSMV